jgi:hypothetical protein
MLENHIKIVIPKIIFHDEFVTIAEKIHGNVLWDESIEDNKNQLWTKTDFENKKKVITQLVKSIKDIHRLPILYKFTGFSNTNDNIIVVKSTFLINFWHECTNIPLSKLGPFDNIIEFPETWILLCIRQLMIIN